MVVRTQRRTGNACAPAVGNWEAQRNVAIKGRTLQKVHSIRHLRFRLRKRGAAHHRKASAFENAGDAHYRKASAQKRAKTRAEQSSVAKRW